MTISSDATRPGIAVVGVSALFPGSVDSTGFWTDILDGTDRMTDVPSSHWLIEDHYDADMAAPDRTYGRRGGFLDPVDLDAMGFGIPPSMIPSTDTAQLLALIVAQRVLDDATRGQFADIDRSRASVILGVTSGQELFGAMASRMNRPMWLQGMRRAGVPEEVALAACDEILGLHPEWTEATFPGLLGNVVAGRIANRLDLGGTNCVTDAACASSFSAISMGVNELYLGDSDLVIAGGVDTMNDIFMYMCFSKTPALSKTEDIRPFSDQADGTMLGEGIGMVALKRLDDAERDGNNIYCVLNGVGASSDGRSKSVYAPVSSGQARALDNAYAKAGYGPDTVELVEAHGTGTVAGDAAEFGGLEIAFNATGRADRQWCALGSVKSQIGHTKAAAGAAGLFKVVMALHHKVLPQTAKIDKPNPKLDLGNSPFHLNTTTRPWVRGSDHERRGSVSSFGFGGSNFHIALSEYTGGGTRAPRLRSNDAELVVLTGVDGADLVAQTRVHVEAANVAGYLGFLAQTSQRAYRADAPVRLALLASSESDLQAKLAQAAQGIENDPGLAFSTPTGVHYGVGETRGDVAFVFPGQGSQYVSMGASLAMNFTEAMAAWDLAADQAWPDRSLQDVVFPITSFDDNADETNDALLTATDWAQPAIGTTSLGILDVLRSIGVEPAHVGGHSFGEITALHAAGVLSADDMIRVARERGRLMAEAAQTPGSMTAVSGSIEHVAAVVEQSGLDVVVANHNSQSQVVLSGPTDAIEQIEELLGAADLRSKRLPVATAFHSPVVSGASVDFTEFLDGIAFDTPSIPVHANETALPYPGDDAGAMRAQLGRQLAQPVRFVEMIEAMYDAGARTFVEVGPSSVLTGLIGKILKGRDHRAVQLDKKNKRGLGPFLNGIGQLAAAGVAMNLDALWREYGEMMNPHDITSPKLAIPINGANFGSPYPPADLSELVGPNEAAPVVAPPVVAAHDTPPAAPRPEQPAAVAPAPVAPAAVQPAVQSVAVQPVPVQPLAQPVSPPPPGVLAAYQAAQQQTAGAHTAYLNSMAQAHQSFLDAAQQSISVLGQLAGLAPSISESRSATVAPPVVAPVSAPAVVTPAPVVVPVPVPVVAAPLIAPSPVPVVPVSAVPAAAVPVEGPAGVVVGVVASVSSGEVMPLLLGVVSDRTGYPSEMLTMEMELEADLGIDSIKRVEILSAMQDLVPELPEVDLGVMGSLSTLGEIVDYLTSQMVAVPVVAVAPVPAAAVPVEGPAGVVVGVVASVSSGEVMPLLLGVVSDRTGYPSEMLTMEMELEADLGIDSIKRVEILSAMQDLVPELPEVDLGVMGSLSTLGEIVDYLTSQMVAVPVVAVAPVPAAAVPVEGPAGVVVGVVASVSSGEVMPLLLGVVSDRTGYPSEMLTMEMELEADLGIDSIKRVEILSAMQDLVPELPEVDLGVMGSLSTLGEIVDYLTSQMVGDASVTAGASAVSPGTSSEVSMSAPFGRFTAEAVSTSASGTPVPGVGFGTLAVVGDPNGVGSALVARLIGEGVDAVLEATVPTSGCSGVVVLDGLADVADVDQAVAVNRVVFEGAQAFATTGPAGGLFVAVTDLGGRIGIDVRDEFRAWTSGITGLTRTATIEWPQGHVKSIDIERGGRPALEIADALANELLTGGSDPEVGLGVDGTRVTVQSVPTEVVPGSMPLGADDVIVVSGGGRGVTAATIVELARESSATFVLLGRSELADEHAIFHSAGDDAALKRLVLDESTKAGTVLTPAELTREVGKILANREIRDTIAFIEKAGGRAIYRALDITDSQVVAKACVAIRAEVGPITGVVHGAGVLADKLIADKTTAQFDIVFDTKVVGLQNLLAATTTDTLKVLCLFSSVAARTGNAGQVDYAMANEIMNKVAVIEQRRRGAGCVVKSLGWGPWAGGMVTPALKTHFESMGVELIALDVGARMFVDELSSPQTDQVDVALGGGVLPQPADA